MSIVKQCVLAVTCDNDAAHKDEPKLSRIYKYKAEMMVDCFEEAKADGWVFVETTFTNRQIALCSCCVKYFND